MKPWRCAGRWLDEGNLQRQGLQNNKLGIRECNSFRERAESVRPTDWSARPADQLARQHLLLYYWASALCRRAVLQTLYSSVSLDKQTDTRVAIRLDTPACEIPSAISEAGHRDSALEPRIPIVRHTVSIVHPCGSYTAIVSRSHNF
jgi:hypothetical protein